MNRFNITRDVDCITIQDEQNYKIHTTTLQKLYELYIRYAEPIYSFTIFKNIVSSGLDLYDTSVQYKSKISEYKLLFTQGNGKYKMEIVIELPYYAFQNDTVRIKDEFSKIPNGDIIVRYIKHCMNHETVTPIVSKHKPKSKKYTCDFVDFIANDSDEKFIVNNKIVIKPFNITLNSNDYILNGTLVLGPQWYHGSKTSSNSTESRIRGKFELKESLFRTYTIGKLSKYIDNCKSETYSISCSSSYIPGMFNHCVYLSINLHIDNGYLYLTIHDILAINTKTQESESLTDFNALLQLHDNAITKWGMPNKHRITNAKQLIDLVNQHKHNTVYQCMDIIKNGPKYGNTCNGSSSIVRRKQSKHITSNISISFEDMHDYVSSPIIFEFDHLRLS